MIFDGDMNVVAGAARRWVERAAHRDRRRGQLAAAVEPPHRVQARLDRLARAAIPAVADAAASVAAVPTAEVLRSIGLERVVGRGDFQDIVFLELGLAVSRFVARVNVRTGPSRGAGFGTGFMVSPRLLLTNNHVLPTAATAGFSEVEFDYQLDRSGRPLVVEPFALQPDLFFLTDVDLDYTLVAVGERSRRGSALHSYGWSRLVADQGKILIGEHLNIVQHPRGQFKQFVSKSNELVDLLENHLHYVTDTEPGSSGSPVYNDQWEVVALHHSGVPRVIDGQYIGKDGKPWDGRDPEDLDWIANEGVRVSSIVRSIEAQTLAGEAARLREELLNLEPPNPVEAARMAAQASAPQGASPTRAAAAGPAAAAGAAAATWPGAVTFTIPLQVTVQLGQPAVGGQPAAVALPPSGQLPDAPPASRQGSPVGAGADRPAGLASALAELDRAAARPYYDAAADAADRGRYYGGLVEALPEPAALFEALSVLLARTHATRLDYAPSTHLYPWVDLRQSTPPLIQSIYSEQTFEPGALIEADFRTAAERARLSEVLLRETTGAPRERLLDLLEASLPFNCEHVVPQSWFEKRQPMRGDLHHLFACEVECNSFRANTPYFDFPDFQETIRDRCGKSEQQGFEPAAGKGAVARATLYFLLRYPGEIEDTPKELLAERLPILFDWHRRFPVGDYERHRNAAIAEKQGNRNPLIDFPQWADRIDFSLAYASAVPPA